MTLRQIFYAACLFNLLSCVTACLGGAPPLDTVLHWSSLASNYLDNAYAAPTIQDKPLHYRGNSSIQSDPVKWQPPNPNSIFQMPNFIAPNVAGNLQAPAFVPPLPPWNLPPQIQYQPQTVMQQIPCGQNTGDPFQEVTPNIFPAPFIPPLFPPSPPQLTYGGPVEYQNVQQFIPLLPQTYPEYILPSTTTTVSAPTFSEAKYLTDENALAKTLKISKIVDKNVNEKKPEPPTNTVISPDGGSFTIHQPGRLVPMSRAIFVNDRTASQMSRGVLNAQQSTSHSPSNKMSLEDEPKSTTQTTVESTVTTTSIDSTTIESIAASTASATTGNPSPTPIIAITPATDSVFTSTAGTIEDNEQYELDLSGYGYGGSPAAGWYGNHPASIGDLTDNYRFRIR